MNHIENPERSGRAVHGEGNELNCEGQYGRCSVLLRHIHKPTKGPYPNCVSRKLLGQTHAVLSRAIPGGSADVGDECTESCIVFQPLRIPSVIRPERRTFVVVVR